MRRASDERGEPGRRDFAVESAAGPETLAFGVPAKARVRNTGDQNSGLSSGFELIGERKEINTAFFFLVVAYAIMT